MPKTLKKRRNTPFVLLVRRAQAAVAATEAPLSLTAVAERCGISRTYLDMLMSGERSTPRDPVLASLAKGLGVSVTRVAVTFAVRGSK